MAMEELEEQRRHAVVIQEEMHEQAEQTEEAAESMIHYQQQATRELAVAAGQLEVLQEERMEMAAEQRQGHDAAPQEGRAATELVPCDRAQSVADLEQELEETREQLAAEVSLRQADASARAETLAQREPLS